MKDHTGEKADIKVMAEKRSKPEGNEIENNRRLKVCFDIVINSLRNCLRLL